MSEQMARALNAADPLVVTINGKDCRVRALGLRELAEVERDCLERYRRNYLQTWHESLEFLPEEERRTEMRARIEEASRWDTKDLPSRFAYDGRRAPLTPELKRLVRELLELGPNEPEPADEQWGFYVTALLDREAITEEQFEKATGVKPRCVKIPYVNWWITGSNDGLMTMVWTCFRASGVTREEVADFAVQNPAVMIEAAREIERLSAPQPGNG